MVNLYYSREEINKDRFLFAQVEKSPIYQNREGGNGKIILLVPDQFTLQAERNAFEHLGVAGLIDVEILSVSRLGFNVLGETGGGNRTFIDKYGRHMLLSRIIAEEEEKLAAFSGMKRSHSFIEMTNDLITEMKQYNTSPEDLLLMMDALEEDSFLSQKLKDIHLIYDRYARELEGKYIDTEDYMELFVSKIGQSELVKNAEIWVTGFDSFTPKSLMVLEQLMVHAVQFNAVLTYSEEVRDRDLFQLPRKILNQLTAIAAKNGISAEWRQIGGEFCVAKEEELRHLEKNLYAFPQDTYSEPVKAVSFCQAANFYGEAETAAAYITELVRDKGFRYRDIAVICNDLDGRGSIIKRVFTEYGICFFMDKKRSVLHSPSVEYVLALLDLFSSNWLYEDVFRLLKTNLTPVFREDYEKLENYAIKYRIRGNRWKQDFKYGASWEGEDGLQQLNAVRRVFAEPVAEFEKKFKEAETATEKTEALYQYLLESGMPGRIDKLVERLNERGEFEAAEEAAQIFKVIVDMLDQVVELLGDQKVSAEDYTSVLKAGFEAVEIGLLPPTMDQVIVGTMQRTRTGRIKAMVVLGANDGILPAASSSEELLSEDEKALLYSRSIEICKDDSMRIQEEKLAIYRNLSKPEQCLFMSYSASDLEGKEMKPSAVLDKLVRMFDQVEIKKDILNQDAPSVRMEAPRSTLKHLAEALREGTENREIAEEWKVAYNWFFRRFHQDAQWNPEYKGVLRSIDKGLFFTNKAERLENSLVNKLYKKNNWEDLILSPSRLERFGRCPFSHFVQYGLKPEELRVFEVAGREVGDVYHECIMRLSEELTPKGMEITAESSPWMSVTKEECDSKIGRLMEQLSQEYREGILAQGEEERYRAERMKEVASSAAWALISHVQSGRIKEIFFEAAFSSAKDSAFPPIEIEAGGQKFRIEGKIDRVDVMKHKEQQLEFDLDALMRAASGQVGDGGTIHDSGEGSKMDSESADSRNEGADGRSERAGGGEATEGSLIADDSLIDGGSGAISGRDSGDGSGEGQEVSYIKVIDYKSGHEKFDANEAKSGWRLQLMIYLQAAIQGIEKRSKAKKEPVKPAGVFYFEIAEPLIDGTKISAEQYEEKIKEELNRRFKLDGVILDDPYVIDSIAGDFTGFSSIVPVRKSKEGKVSGTGDGKLLEEPAFQELRQEVEKAVTSLCKELAEGSIDIEPKKTKTDSACTFCRYKGICCFDLAFEGCGYKTV